MANDDIYTFSSMTISTGPDGDLMLTVKHFLVLIHCLILSKPSYQHNSGITKEKRQQKFRHQVWCMAFAPHGSEGYTQCETPSGTPWSLRRCLLKIHTFPLPPQTLLLRPVAGQLCFLSASGWSVQEQFLLPWPFSFHPVHGHALVCYRHHPNDFPLDSWRALQRGRSFVESVTCRHRAPSGQLTTVLGLRGSLPVRRVWTNFCCS